MSESSQNITRNGELLPCPFCGGEAHMSASSDGYGVECWNRRCIDMQMEQIPTEAEAIAAWNTRADDYRQAAEYWQRMYEEAFAERTCRNNAPDYLDFLCSWCGFVHYHSDENDMDGGNGWNYCPNCGAKVVEE